MLNVPGRSQTGLFSLWSRVVTVLLALAVPVMAQETGGEANLKLPPLDQAHFLGSIFP